MSRQPVLDRKSSVCAYDLRYQPCEDADSEDDAAEHAAARLITEALSDDGLDELTHGRPAFVGLPASFIEHDLARALPPGRVVYTVKADAHAGPAFLDACRRLREDGYQLALDECILSQTPPELLAIANFVRLDFLRTPTRDTSAILARRDSAGTGFVADRVDDLAVFSEALREGFTHFQGPFYQRPATSRRSGRIPTGQVGYLRLLQALGNTNLSVNDLEDLIKHDASLCFRILTTVNSAGFGQSREITSMHQALVLLGRDTIRRWASLWILAGLGADAHSELVTAASVRARLCETLTARQAGDLDPGEGFLLGMCSLLDAILERPMTEILEELPLSSDVSSALVGYDNSRRHLLDCVIAYERGDWNTCRSLASLTGLETAWLRAAYIDALRWARQLRSAV